MERTTGFVVAGFGLGAAAMFIFDPASGRRRRALVRDKRLHLWKTVAHFFRQSKRDLQHRVRGTVAEVKARRLETRVDDDILVERVRAKLGRLVAHAHRVEVHADHGYIVLRGTVSPVEKLALLAGVKAIPGVRDVEHELLVEGAKLAAGLPPRIAARLKQPWKPATRLVAGTAGLGVAMALLGLRR
jgi:hyperosmotically inducible protein